MTSELTNALNPYISQSRPRTWQNYSTHVEHHHYPDPSPSVIPQPYIPHRSELEFAIQEPPQPAPLPPCPQPPPNPPAPTIPSPTDLTIRRLLRALAQTQETAEAEKVRRAEWEKEQESKYAERQAQLENQISAMRDEITTLKTQLAERPSSEPTSPVSISMPQYSSHLMGPEDTMSSEYLPSPVSQAPYPQFVEGSSSNPLGSDYSPSPDFTASTASSSYTMLPSPQSPSVEVVTPHHTSHANTPKPSEHQSNIDDDNDDGSESESEQSDSGPPTKPPRRKNGHDTRCLTIHHAMRKHILRMMKVINDKHLPDSHVEGQPISPGDPVRFVWDKTPKQSLHNTQMKKRVVGDLRSKRRLYRHVPDKDFAKKTIEGSFDQVFTTLRQKFKAQRDSSLAVDLKRREDHKAMKSRRLSRKKTKLSSRSNMRTKMATFSHATFDGALQQDCMSSEESCEEYAEESQPSGVRSKVQVFQVRGLPWRSSRLLRFYATLDENSQVDRSLQPKRGTGRKARCAGPDKDGFHMPPKGVSSWMISQRWTRHMELTHPDVLSLLEDTVEDKEGFDWDLFKDLGVETEDEGEPGPEPEQIARSETSYSLAHALAPPEA